MADRKSDEQFNRSGELTVRSSDSRTDVYRGDDGKSHDHIVITTNSGGDSHMVYDRAAGEKDARVDTNQGDKPVEVPKADINRR